MPRVLTVDDSRSVRSIVTKQMKALNFDVDEAEDGQQALDRLEEVAVDLILLDVTMPVMDGPTMLAKLRGRGDKTPVIMLTSEAKRSIVAEAMKLGIEDYILKPFKPDELLVKIRTALKLPGASAAIGVPAPAEVDSGGDAASGETNTSKQFIDVMLVDDMENVAKRLKTLLPTYVTLNSFTSGPSALAACRERVCRVILVDTEIPDVDSAALAGQLKVLQPHAAMIALTLKSATDHSAELKAQGFADVLYKPLSPDAIEDFVLQFFDKQELLIREDNVIKIGAFAGKEDRLDRYVARLGTLFPPALDQVASACFEDAIVDLSKVLMQVERLPKMMAGVADKAKAIGLLVRLVGPPEMNKMLAGFEETRSLKIFSSVADAKAMAA